MNFIRKNISKKIKECYINNLWFLKLRCFAKIEQINQTFTVYIIIEIDGERLRNCACNSIYQEFFFTFTLYNSISNISKKNKHLAATSCRCGYLNNLYFLCLWFEYHRINDRVCGTLDKRWLTSCTPAELLEIKAFPFFPRPIA